MASGHAALIFGTGMAGPSQRDAYWDVVGVPTNWGAAPVVPYDAYIFQKGGINWYGGEAFGVTQTGYTNGDGQFYWIGIHSGPGSVIGFPTVWHWIVAQSFTVAQAGNYAVSFPAFSDELLTVYLNGTVVPNALTPTISGGTLLTSGSTNGVSFTSVKTINTQAYFNAGTNTVYAQIRDSGFSTGVMLGSFTLTSLDPPAAVPEPGTWAAALLLVGGAAFARWRR